MKPKSLLAQIALAEDSTRQFKADVKYAPSLTPEMAAFIITGGMVPSGHANPTNDLFGMDPAA